MSRPPLYDAIGRDYRVHRRTDARTMAAIADALGAAESVVNVGAGAGSYEPGDRPVVAVEPSRTMIAQRHPGAAPAVRATAMALPFADGAFAASLAVLTVHHWPDPARGLAEMARVARERAVILTSDPDAPPFCLTADYFPEIAACRAILPTMGDFERALGRFDRLEARFRSRTTAPTGSSAPTGAVRPRISMPLSAPRSPRSR
jgi:SAM-dependent methyltransferase